ncbi:hypothetical protein GCM10009838_34740 [Catenulispora subtropica]|uniref:Uncharacterized protein n=2 Tax=Catenulispora subtropica TaxID=450798 RepID=A0ABN2RNS5_9ACTN
MKIGGSPLALAQAAAYRLPTGRSLADYLRLLREDHEEILARNAPAGRAAPMAAAWSPAMAEREATSPADRPIGMRAIAP